MDEKQFPSPSGDFVFLLAKLDKEMNHIFDLSFRPLPGILFFYQKWNTWKGVLWDLCFRPLPGILFFYALKSLGCWWAAKSFRPLPGILFFYHQEH